MRSAVPLRHFLRCHGWFRAGSDASPCAFESGGQRVRRALARFGQDTDCLPEASSTKIGKPLRDKEYIMLYYAVVFLIIAIIAGFFGFFGVAGLAATIAKILFIIFIILFILSLIFGRRRVP
jgi:uncharacterized membrane protein YtjA (UPF0391 family)